MARLRPKTSALQIALVWLLALVVLPLTAGASMVERGLEACELWCPCDQGEAAALGCGDDCEDGEDCEAGECDADSESDCEDGCSEGCSSCCSARTALALGFEPFVPPVMLVAFVPSWAPVEARGRRVADGVFRPPRSLT